ncbi:TPA: restriction endonuclease [Pseudomonas aeruginosa]|uniref:restriction endonuclease n=1 Tax=Pseudomonas TaxID=286 RepID=UPI001A22E760|nr:restriction endonuclease [Pseudomonas aeruginosa]MBH3536194.1 restriction endonuclease [Pseudomonas aeruginosa]MBX6553229.1 restriction endonuclease [Pseudomonas aeruginosa]MBX6585253.1 restriction endonuclease [Pseudomonas aeruginosa]MBX6615391.1 restriction endonuclease [Pseudomonas aeruginosa]MBX6878728.1 restriction endonuclease [Pseudomonas aeruginosa]
MAMNFFPGDLAETLSEMAGYKVGLALSVEEICEHLAQGPGKMADIIRHSEVYGIRIRSEEYEALHYRLLHRIGYTKNEQSGLLPGISDYRKYKACPELLEISQRMKLIFTDTLEVMMDEALAKGERGISPIPFLDRCRAELGPIGLKMAYEFLQQWVNAQRTSPYHQSRSVEWQSPLELKKLFTGTDQTPEAGKFIDQRYLDYLANNTNRLQDMHWRKFEEMTAEYFERVGFRVEIGPGSNDDGVDVRLWKPDAPEDAKPTCLVQCKRQKAKIEKVIVKGLAADVQYMEADYGMIITTSTLSPGAEATITARGYPIQAVERDAVTKWLERLRTPGTGIVRV